MTPFTESIVGTWRAVRAELDGASAPTLAVEQIRLHFTGSDYRYVFGGEAADAGSWTATTAADHFVLTFSGKRGANAGRDVPAIAQLRGDRLRICYGLDGVLPRAFESSAGSSRYLVTLRREAAHDAAD